MSNKRLVSILVTMFLCFVVLFGSAGCGGNNNSSNFAENEPTTTEPNPIPTPIVSPDPIPEPAPSDPEPVPTPIVSPDPVPQPDPVPESPDVPEPTPVSPVQPLPEPVPVVSPDPVPPTPLPEPEPELEPEPEPYYPEPEPEPVPSGYTVFFDSKGGSIVPSIHVSSGSTVDMPENPTRDGYIFAGWYKDEDFTEIFAFGADGDKITQNTTLYAQWIKLDTLKAEYAIGEIVIGYAEGDNPKYVTQNLQLPFKVEMSGDVNISWSSNNPVVISPEGIVTRPQGSDADVILTAEATSGTESVTRDFNLKVIRAHSRVSTDVEVVPVQNAGSGDISIKYNASGDQIVDIEGQYSRITILNADDALDAIHGIRVELGINNPYEELKLFNVTSDSSGSEYQFQQVYDGVRVYGYGIMASANYSGKADFLHANILSTDILEKLDRSSLMLNTSSDAESAVKNLYTGNIEPNSADTELVIFALGKYEDAPVYAYVVSVAGTDGDGKNIDDTIIINASTGAVAFKSTNIYEARSSNTKIVNSKNESGDLVSFDVKLSGGYWRMIDDTEIPTIEVYSGDVSDFTYTGTFLWHNDRSVKRRVGEENSGWDEQAVSAYTNMREVLRWWKDSFDRNSLDGKGMVVKLIVHQKVINDKSGNIEKDNAAWHFGKERMYIYDKESKYLSTASAVDVLTHESTHAVLQYITGIESWGEESPLRSITEGYADVFACLKDRNWKIGEVLFSSYGPEKCVRNIETRYAGDLPTQAYEDSVNYISYAAYLMYKNGLTWDELGKLWYKSMSMGYPSKTLFWTTEKKILDKTATFFDVQRCLIWAAEKLIEAGELPHEKLLCVYNALAETFYQPATLSGTITDYDDDTKPIQGVEVRADFSSNLYKVTRCTSTDETGKYSVQFYNDGGKCNVSFNIKSNYASPAHIYDVDIEAMKDNKLDFQLIKSGEGYLTGTVLNSSDNSVIENVRVIVNGGFNSNEFAEETSTDINGHYSFEVDFGAGYFTVELQKSGYKTARHNIIISGNTMQNFYMSRDSESEPVNPDEPTPANPDVPQPVDPNTPFDEPISSDELVVEDIPLDAVHFPYQRFRSHLRLYDIDHNGVLSATEIKNIKQISTVFYRRQFTSLQGIEYLTSLVSLDCSGNSLTTLDVSNCSALKYLNCSDNEITTLKVKDCTNLEVLRCSHILIDTLDVSGCTSLRELICPSHTITVLNIKGCLSLEIVKCYGNPITTLDIKSCPALRELDCDGSDLTKLDMRGCPELEHLSCTNNELTIINVNGCSKLKSLICENNQITTLDVGNCPSIYAIDCANNQLTALDVSSCINLRDLECDHNQLTNLNVSGCYAMNYLKCQNNQLTTLDVSGLSHLYDLNCRSNQLTILDVSGCSAIYYLDCYKNNLRTLDLSSCTNLYSSNLRYDSSKVTIRWPSSNTTQVSNRVSISSGIDSNNYTEIVARISAFTPYTTTMYSFKLSLDHEVSEGTYLTLCSDSQDLQGTFIDENSKKLVMPIVESLDHVNVSAYLEAGRVYTPVVIATTNNQKVQSGGCNSGVYGIMLLIISVFITRKR